MATERKGGDLFIVDNSISGWTGLRYLEEWSGIAKSFDIATEFFEIGALLLSPAFMRDSVGAGLDTVDRFGGWTIENLGATGRFRTTA